MHTKEKAKACFGFDNPNLDSGLDRINKHRGVGAVFVNAVDELWALMPDGPGKTYALRKLRDASLAVHDCIGNDGQ